VSADAVVLAERYVLESPIASGGMATVWQARDDVLARNVAIKILHQHLADNDEFLERFRREALAAARLSHPNIVAIYDTGKEKSPRDEVERYFIVMEHCGGGTLASLSATQGVLEPAKAAEVGAVICDALAYAHRNGVVHRDVKPANVLITSDRTLKVADFGIAKAAFTTGDLNDTGAILGTVTYLSPEQLKGDSPDGRSDLYSLGAVLYEVLCGRPPFVAETRIGIAMKHLREKPPPLRSIRAGIPKTLEAVVMKALEKDPEKRHRSAAEMRDALDATVGEPSSATAVFEKRSLEATRAPRDDAYSFGLSREIRRFIPVLLLLVVAIVAAVFIPRLVEQRPPPGPRKSTPTPPLRQIAVASVTAFDPAGDGQEHSPQAHLAADGNLSTQWTTEHYTSPLQALKPGVGLVFDLGQARKIERVTLVSNSPGYSFQLRASNTPQPVATGFRDVAGKADASRITTLRVSPATARYWLVWITGLPPTGSASLAEVRFRGS
jgi:serine/threonine-protein kinase